MGYDWAMIALMGAIGFSCIQIFLTYRRQVNLIQPAVEQLESSREDIENKIKESEEATEEIHNNIAQLNNQLTSMEETRAHLQEKLCENEMILIPAGDFLMGDDEGGATDEYPEHSALLNAFLIDKYPVTNAQYKMFIDITAHRAPPQWAGGTYAIDEAENPITNVSWNDAHAYCKWVNKRLPSEAEWEKAARGKKGQIYPWGSAFRKDNINCNNEFDMTTSVKEFPGGASPYGVMDMCGNASEWVEDWYFDEYYKSSPMDNPQGPTGGQYRVTRGGFFGENKAGVRCSSRHYSPPAAMQEHVGFRCAKSREK